MRINYSFKIYFPFDYIDLVLLIALATVHKKRKLSQSKKCTLTQFTIKILSIWTSRV